MFNGIRVVGMTEARAWEIAAASVLANAKVPHAASVSAQYGAKIMELAGEGHTSRQIAERFNLDPRQVAGVRTYMRKKQREGRP